MYIRESISPFNNINGKRYRFIVFDDIKSNEIVTPSLTDNYGVRKFLRRSTFRGELGAATNAGVSRQVKNADRSNGPIGDEGAENKNPQIIVLTDFYWLNL